MSVVENIRHELLAVSDKERSISAARYFKTGKGEYAEGDVFLGVTVPEQRRIVKQYQDLVLLDDIQTLIRSELHEERLVALLFLVGKFKKANELERELMVDFYLRHREYVNNWDLVDSSADKILGEWLLDKEDDFVDKTLLGLAASDSMWDRRIAIIATFAFIRSKRYREVFLITETLLNDMHDLIHKACGWMLREVGKNCSQEIEEEFLKKYADRMPRTMLRYAIERFPEALRKEYLQRPR